MRPFLILLFLTTPIRADESWSSFKEKNGVSYEKRAVSGSKFYEYRGVTTVPVSPQQAASAVWHGIVDAVPKTVAKREILKKGDDEYLVYDQVKTPVVSDRDVTILIKKVAKPTESGGGFEIKFEAANQLGPPANASFVRIPVVRGQWILQPAPGGGTRITYTCYSEPGGSIPAWMVRGAQQDQVVLDVERMLERLRSP
jgi:hypothetical protein